MERKQAIIHPRFSGAFLILGALMLLVLPLKWLMAAAFAAAVHEGFHWLAIKLSGGRVRNLHIGTTGAVMELEPLSHGKELFCALAGPIGGLLLLLFAKWLPRTAICAAIQSAYNLLPLFPLDGGRALRCGAKLLLPPKVANHLCQIVEVVVRIALCCLGIWATFFWNLGILPLLMALVTLFRTFSEKLLAK